MYFYLVRFSFLVLPHITSFSCFLRFSSVAALNGFVSSAGYGRYRGAVGQVQKTTLPFTSGRFLLFGIILLLLLLLLFYYFFFLKRKRGMWRGREMPIRCAP